MTPQTKFAIIEKENMLNWLKIFNYKVTTFIP